MSGKNEKAKRRASLILAPNGEPASGIEATESEESTPADIHYFRALVRDRWPLLTARESEAQAQAMLARHPVIEKAYRAGLRQGRDLRERSQRGLGWWWEEMAALQPNERGFVMAKVREAIGVEQ